MAEPTEVVDPRPPLSDDDPRLRVAIFRYGVIAPLVTHVLGPRELAQLVREIAERSYRQADGQEVRISIRTVWRWLAQHQRGGIDALLPKQRKDRGAARMLAPDALAFAVDRRVEDRSRSAAMVLDMLERAGVVKRGAVSRQTIDRALRRLDLERIPRRRQPDEKVRKRISVDAPNELWVGDYHDLVAVPLRAGGFLRVHVHAFIDHKTRWIPFAAYYPSQATYTLEDAFKKSVLKGGCPKVIYVDNAKVYRSAAFTHACSRIGTRVLHSKPYESEGRGVIERFWGTLKALFESEVLRRSVQDLDELNRLLQAWLEEVYHARRHEELGAAPKSVRASFVPAFPSVATLAELFLVKVCRKVHPRLSTVEVEGAAFHVDPALRRKRVQVHYDPHDLSQVIIYFDGRRIQRAERALPNTTPQAGSRGTPIEPKTTFDYLGQVLIDHERHRARDARALSFADLEPPTPFDLEAFARHLEIAAGRPLAASDRVAAQDVLTRYGPLDERVVTLALNRAQTARGRGLHVRVYLDFISNFHVERGGKPT